MAGTRRRVIGWADKETGEEIPERQVAFNSAGALGLPWVGDKEATKDYPAASMFRYEGEAGTEIWLAYVPGRFYAFEAWIQGYFKSRIRMTVETLFELPSMAALMERILKRLVLVEARERQAAAGVPKRDHVSRGEVSEFVEAAFRLHGYREAGSEG